MSCGCNKKFRKPKTQNCTYTFNQLTAKLNELNSQENPNEQHTFYLTSAIQEYSTNCNKFNTELAQIMP
jgi:hypothetical protein